MLRVGSLFSGIGGFDLGFERAGMRSVWQAEIDPFASAVLRKHWPKVINHGDIRKIVDPEPVDVLCGGFPCQDISVAGKGAGITGARSGLWSEYARLVRELRPRWVVAENVPALRTRGYDRVHDDLEAAGYTVQAFVVGADDIGAPHRRKRVWIIAHTDCEPVRLPHAPRRSASPFAGVESSMRDVADANSTRLEGRNGGCVQKRAGEFTARTEGAPNNYWQREAPPEPAICDLDDGLPAGLVRHRRPALAALGNSLIPQIAEAIGNAILKYEMLH